ncbi:hypothetical protein VTK73DRAFT_7553 [Phialemonium thermophilum]|uniref:Methyltransferase domain-containing protein n=1 Tax=Phialemonium thermophilum TaxID=223376 RepID=A0ABR3XS44_9PEZI
MASSVPAPLEPQSIAAERMYAERAATYEDSWHPDYTARLMTLIPLRPGDHVLSLCCGTGLDAFASARAVGPQGRVVGVDVSEPMLSVARAKLQARTAAAQQRGSANEKEEAEAPVVFLRHDVTNLDGLDEGAKKEVPKGGFDAIICSSAFVLFPNPAGVVRHWREYLKPGGLLVVDIAHERNMRSGLVMEKVAKRLGKTYPSDRAWIKSRDSFRDILVQEGFVVESITELEKVAGRRSTYLTLDRADEQFDYVVNSSLANPVMTDEFKQQARPIFKEEFAKMAVDGKVEVVETLYVYVARKGD